MTKPVLYILTLSSLLLVASCQSVEQLSIDYLLPADVSFPQQLKKVAIVNNVPADDSEPSVTKTETESDYIETATFSGNPAITAEALAQALAEGNYFDEVVICDSALQATGSTAKQMLETEEANQLINDLQVDFLIALEDIKIRTRRKISYVPGWNVYHGTVDANVYPSISVYLPNGLQNTASSSSQNKNYERTATEVTYGVGKTHRTKLMKAGTIQKISIAATIDANAMPANMTEKEVKTLIAHAASPNLTADDVSIAYVETIDPYLAADRPVNLPVPAASGNPWWLALVLIIGGLVIGFVFVHKKLKDSSSDQADELKQLKEKAKEQEKQIADVNLKAAELIEKQTILTQELLEQQKQMQIENKPENDVSLDETIDDISSDIVYADSDKTLKELKSWIEKS